MNKETLVRGIVRDYNGHYRIDQIDLDECSRLDALRVENEQQKERIRELERACSNLDAANCKISQELNETRWELIRAQQKIKELEVLEIDWEVVHD